MTSRALRIAPELQLPLDAVTETFAILAVKRAGKSNAAVVMAEQMYDAGIPWVAIDPKGDWWGVRAAGDGQAPGLSVLVLGGMHSDIPLEPAAGKLVANLIVEQRITCVLDVSEMTKADQRRFLTDFAGELYRKNTEPLHVFCEEADEYIPQRVMGEAAKLVGAFETLVKRGGFRGIGITLITQRSASLNKDVLTQAGTLIAMRTPSPQDRKAVLAWIDHHAASRDVIDELPTLEAGEAWVFSPQWLKTLAKIRFHRRRTFDSGATPKVGGKPRPPARLADVDLPANKEQLAETIERAKADDPKELRAQIRELEKSLAAKPTTETVTVEIPVLDPALVQEIRDALDYALAIPRDLLLEATEALARHNEQARQTPAKERGVRTGEATRGRSSAAPSASTRPGELVTPGAPTARPAAARKETRPTTAAGTSTSQQRILNALAALEHIGVTAAEKTQLALFAEVSPKSSGYTNNLGSLRAAGLIEYPAPKRVALTDSGRAGADATGPPSTVEDLHGYVRELVGASKARILDALIAIYPDAIPKADLAGLAGVSASSSGYTNNLGSLRSLGLIDYPSPGYVAAEPVLFLGGNT